MSYRFEIAAGASKKLLVGGKYCEEDIIVTALGGSDAPDIPDAPVTPEYSEGLLIEWTDWRGGYEVNGRGDCTDSIVVIPDSFDDGVHGESPVIGLGYTENDKFVYVFYEDDTLVEIYLPYGMALDNSTSLTYCPNLKKVYGVGSVSSSFELVNLPSLEYVEFTPSTEWISGGIGSGSGNGAVYDFSKCTSIPSFGSYGFGEEFGTDPVIVVPENLLEEWKQATNWTLYADYIVAEGQENAQEKTIEITENGSYEVIPDEGKLLRKVTVNVDTPDKKPEQEKTLNVTKDGTYTVTPDSGYVLKKVSVLVDTPDQKPEQNKSINVTENGSYSLTPDTGFVLNGATVNVAIPLKAEQEKTVDITNSGSFEILPDEGKLLSKVTVNASSGEDNIYSEGLEMEWDMAGYYIVNGRGDCTDKVIRIPDAYSDGTHGRARVAIFKNSALNSDELLTAVHIPTTMNTVSNGVLYGCPNLKKIYMPSIKMLENYSFRGSSSLEYVEFGWEIGSLGQNVFANCKSGAVFDFSKCYAVPTLDLGGWGYEFGSNPVIKVPNHLLSRWKIATNWTQYASYIVAAE